MKISEWYSYLRNYDIAAFHLASLCLLGFLFVLTSMMAFNTYYNVNGLKDYKKANWCVVRTGSIDHKLDSTSCMLELNYQKTKSGNNISQTLYFHRQHDIDFCKSLSEGEVLTCFYLDTPSAEINDEDSGISVHTGKNHMSTSEEPSVMPAQIYNSERRAYERVPVFASTFLSVGLLMMFLSCVVWWGKPRQW